LRCCRGVIDGDFSVSAVPALTYDAAMSETQQNRIRLTVALIGGVAALSVTLLALDGWMRHGTAIFLAMAESGMSWCL
jgi:hypothetical protein